MPGKKRGTGVLPSITTNYGAGGNKSIISRGVPKIVQRGTGLRVCYTEPFGEVVSPSSGLYKVRRLIGGGFASTPWLSSIARNYGKFRIHRIRFFYSSIVPTTSSGEVSFAVSTEFDDSSHWIGGPATPDDLLRFQNWVMGPVYGGSSTGMASDSNHFAISQTAREIHQTYPWFLVGPTTADSLPNLSYPIQFLAQCGSNGVANTVGGRFFVDYDIEFSCPVPGNLVVPASIAPLRDEVEEIIVPLPPRQFPSLPDPQKSS